MLRPRPLSLDRDTQEVSIASSDRPEVLCNCIVADDSQVLKLEYSPVESDISHLLNSMNLVEIDAYD
jgi:hypothetical protein